MALLVRVGSLTSWFAPALRADAERHGDDPPSDEDVRRRVEAWRSWVSDGLRSAGHVSRDLDWDESDPAVDSFDLGVEPLTALRLWLAHDGGPSAPRVLPDHPERDPRWHELARDDFADSEWDQILVPELWLPASGAFTFPCPYPDGHEVQAGLVGALRDQLGALHEKKLAATPFDAHLAAAEGPPDTRELWPLARHAGGVLTAAAARAASRGLPMILQPT